MSVCSLRLMRTSGRPAPKSGRAISVGQHVCVAHPEHMRCIDGSGADELYNNL